MKPHRIVDFNRKVIGTIVNNDWVFPFIYDLKVELIEESKNLKITKTRESTKTQIGQHEREAKEIKLKSLQHELKHRYFDLDHTNLELKKLEIELQQGENVVEEYAAKSLVRIKHKQRISEIKNMTEFSITFERGLIHDSVIVEPGKWTRTKWHDVPISYFTPTMNCDAPFDSTFTTFENIQVHKIVSCTIDGSKPSQRLKPGMIIDCLDHQKRWYGATILKEGKTHYYITYNCWDHKWNEWIEKDSERLAPQGTHELNTLKMKDLENLKEPESETTKETSLPISLDFFKALQYIVNSSNNDSIPDLIDDYDSDSDSDLISD